MIASAICSIAAVSCCSKKETNRPEGKGSDFGPRVFEQQTNPLLLLLLALCFLRRVFFSLINVFALKTISFFESGGQKTSRFFFSFFVFGKSHDKNDKETQQQQRKI